MPERIGVGLTGASGAVYGLRLLELLAGRPEFEVHVVATRHGEELLMQECGRDLDSLREFGVTLHQDDNLGAGPSSGTFRMDKFAIVPCSVNTLAKVANGIADNLICRIAANMLKARRFLLLLVREMPLSTIQLRNMTGLSEAGAVVMPASPGFYTHPKTVSDLVDHVVGYILDLLAVPHDLPVRWCPSA